MPAISNCPRPNGSAMAQGAKACAPLAKARLARPAARYQTPTASIGRGSERQEAKKPRLNTICQRPGSIHRLSGATRKSTTVSSAPATPAGMDPARACHHFNTDEHDRDRGGRDPEREIAEDVGRRLREPEHLDPGGG